MRRRQQLEGLTQTPAVGEVRCTTQPPACSGRTQSAAIAQWAVLHHRGHRAHEISGQPLPLPRTTVTSPTISPTKVVLRGAVVQDECVSQCVCRNVCVAWLQISVSFFFYTTMCPMDTPGLEGSSKRKCVGGPGPHRAQAVRISNAWTRCWFRFGPDYRPPSNPHSSSLHNTTCTTDHIYALTTRPPTPSEENL